MFKNATIGTKVIGLVVLLMAILVFTSGIGVLQMNKIGNEIHEIAEEDLPLIDHLTKVTTRQLEQAVEFERVLRYAGVSLQDRDAARQLVNKHERKFQSLDDSIKEELALSAGLARKGLEEGLTKQAREEFRVIGDKLEAIDKHHAAYAEHVRDSFVAVERGDLEAAEKLSIKIEQEEDQLNMKVEELLSNIENFTGASALRAEQDEQAGFRLMVIAAVVAAILGLTLGVMLTRTITRPLREAVSAAKRIAEGDLTVRLETDATDESGQLLKALEVMKQSLLNITKEIHVACETVKDASKELADNGISLSQRTEEQASSLEETASSMEEMTGSVRTTTESAEEAREIAASNRDRASRASSVAARTSEAMREINESSNNISNIIGAINDIAFQTNLLALNAAVEAARAGEQGRGFAVVAGEVRELSQRAAASAKEIKELIVATVDKIRSGSELVDESDQALQDIIEGTVKVNELIGRIADSSREQYAGIEQVNTAVTQLDDMTQQNAAMVEESASAANSLNDQAQHMMDLVSYFRFDDRKLTSGNAAGKLPPQEAPVPADTGNGSIRTPVSAMARSSQPVNETEWEQF